MNNGFRRSRAGVQMRLQDAEQQLIRSMLTQLVELLENEAMPTAADDPLAGLVALGPDTSPEDPAVERLLPDAYRDDPSAAAEFRRLTQEDLRSGKVVAARTALTTLDRIQGGRAVLDADETQAWLSALNDIRLVLGTRFDVTEETYDDFTSLPPDDARLPGLVVYVFLGELQETLVHAVAGW